VLEKKKSEKKGEGGGSGGKKASWGASVTVEKENDLCH